MRILMRHFPCDVGEVDNGMDALRDNLAQPQDSVFVGIDIGLLDANGLARQLRQTQHGHRPALVRVLPPDGHCRPRERPGAATWPSPTRLRISVTADSQVTPVAA